MFSKFGGPSLIFKGILQEGPSYLDPLDSGFHLQSCSCKIMAKKKRKKKWCKKFVTGVLWVPLINQVYMELSTPYVGWCIYTAVDQK